MVQDLLLVYQSLNWFITATWTSPEPIVNVTETEIEFITLPERISMLSKSAIIWERKAPLFLKEMGLEPGNIWILNLLPKWHRAVFGCSHLLSSAAPPKEVQNWADPLGLLPKGRGKIFTCFMTAQQQPQCNLKLPLPDISAKINNQRNIQPRKTHTPPEQQYKCRLMYYIATKRKAYWGLRRHSKSSWKT